MQPETGFVTLCGAGPGDADLLTLGALKAIQSAQALLYDALVGDDILALAPRGASGFASASAATGCRSRRTGPTP